jgi:replication initiator protein RepSA
MLGFGGHFLTKSQRHKVTFRLLRDNRAVYIRTVTTGPEPDHQTPEQETILVVNFLEFVGSGWHNTGDAMLAAASADLACSRREATQQFSASRHS